MGKRNTKLEFSLLTNLCYKTDFMIVILCRLWVYPSWTAPVINVGHCFKHGLMFDMKKQKFYFLHFCMPYSKVTSKIRKVRARVWVLLSFCFTNGVFSMLGRKFVSDKNQDTQRKLLYIFCELKLPKSDFQNQFSMPRVFLKKKKKNSWNEMNQFHGIFFGYFPFCE